MSFLSIKKQIVQIVQTLTYKAYGFNVYYPWTKAQLISNKQQEKIGYKIPIPNLIYNKYSEQGFMYSDPGTTPRQIAQDILTHFKCINHLQMQSDQFGNIIGYVKQQYFSQVSEQFIKGNKIKCLTLDELGYHHNQSVKLKSLSSEQVTQSSKQLMVVFRQDIHRLSLSQLRQRYVFEAILRIERDIFNRDAEMVNVFSSDCVQKNKKQHLTRQMPQQTKQQLSKFNLNSHQLLYGSLRHQVIENECRIQSLLNIDRDRLQKQQSDDVKLLKFGIVIPQDVLINYCESHDNNTNNDNIHNIQLSAQQISKLKSIFYDHPLHKPINLSLIKEVNCQFHSLLSRQLITLPSTVQELILKVDQLASQHKVNELYHMYLMLNQLLSKQPSTSIQVTQQNIIKTRYLSVGKVIAQHLDDILYF